jgi:hypothetical protein
MVQDNRNGAGLRDQLFGLFSQCWRRETSYDPEHWSAKNPAWGQCAVTALIVQDLLGGALLRANINGIEHYWNQLPDFELDLTRHQFRNIKSETPAQEQSREFVLSFPDTVRRYKLLVALVHDTLGTEPFSLGKAGNSRAGQRGFLRP